MGPPGAEVPQNCSGFCNVTFFVGEQKKGVGFTEGEGSSTIWGKWGDGSFLVWKKRESEKHSIITGCGGGMG